MDIIDKKADILIVDDEDTNLHVLSSALKNNYRLYIANNARRALDILENNSPDLILLDIMMPEMDGFQLTKILKSDEKYSEIPIIFITAKTDVDSLVEGFNLGAVDYITKPFNLKELNKRVDLQIKLIQAKNKIISQNHELEILNNDLQETKQMLEKRNEDFIITQDNIEEHAFKINQLNQKLMESEYQLMKKNEELTQLNFDKDKFFSIIAHDLKSPFSGLLGINQILEDEFDTLGDDEMKEMIEALNITTKRIYNLIENLLEWSRLQQGRISLQPEIIYVKKLVNSVEELFLNLLKTKDLKINNFLDDNLHVMADEGMLHTALRNMISNSIKFSHSGKSIDISKYQEDDESVTLRIRDYGVGIEPENLLKLFKINEQLSTPGTLGERGTGLGLLISKEFVLKNKGDLWIESEKGEGTSYFLKLMKKL
jgi:two-component system sensor histidine kinase/response regulator